MQASFLARHPQHGEYVYVDTSWYQPSHNEREPLYSVGVWHDSMPDSPMTTRVQTFNGSDAATFSWPNPHTAESPEAVLALLQQGFPPAVS